MQLVLARYVNLSADAQCVHVNASNSPAYFRLKESSQPNLSVKQCLVKRFDQLYFTVKNVFLSSW